MGENTEKNEQKIDETVKVEISPDTMLGVISFTEPKNGGKT